VFDIKPDVDVEFYMMALKAQESGPGFTVCLYGQPIGAAGISIQKPGYGEAWSILGPLIKRFPVFLHRTVKSEMRRIAAGLNEVWAVCEPGNSAWLERLGMFPVKRAEKPELYRKVEPGQRLFVMRRKG
jgi:hypothetical protein